MALIPEGFKVGTVGIIAHKRHNNLYILSMWKEGPISFVNTSSPNEDIMDIWHARLGHLGAQNVKRLAGMSSGMDLTKSIYSRDACQKCSEMQGRDYSYKPPITPGVHPNKLIHSDLVGLLPLSSGGANYFATFLDDYTEGSDVYFLTSKTRLLLLLELQD